MAMIPTTQVGGNQFAKARGLMSAVVVIDSRTFRVPSSSRGERDHKIHIDDTERPRAVSCTCESGELGRPCWAMARVLDALETLRSANVYVCRGAASTREALEEAAGAVEPPLRAMFLDGELALLRRSATPLAGMVLNV